MAGVPVRRVVGDEQMRVLRAAVPSMTQALLKCGPRDGIERQQTSTTFQANGVCAEVDVIDAPIAEFRDGSPVQQRHQADERLVG